MMKKGLFEMLLSLLLISALGGCASVSANDMAVGEIQSLMSDMIDEAVWYTEGETAAEGPLTEEELSSVVTYLRSIKDNAANTTPSPVIASQGIRLTMKDGTQWEVTPGSTGSKVHIYFSEQEYTVTIKCKDLAKFLAQHSEG